MPLALVDHLEALAALDVLDLPETRETRDLKVQRAPPAPAVSLVPLDAAVTQEPLAPSEAPAEQVPLVAKV